MALKIRRAWRKNADWEGSARDWTDRLHDMATRSPMEWTIREFSSLRRVLSFLQSRESRAVPDREGMPLLRAADVAADMVARMCGLDSYDIATPTGRRLDAVWRVVLNVRRGHAEPLQVL